MKRPEPTALTLAPAPRAALDAWARRAWPREACGLLFGPREGGSAEAAPVAVAQAAEVLNRAQGNDRFELDPESFLAAERAARLAGYALLGIWHSHPGQRRSSPADAVPSTRDRDGVWPGWLQLIGALGPGGSAEWRAWRASDLKAGWRELALLADLEAAA